MITKLINQGIYWLMISLCAACNPVPDTKQTILSTVRSPRGHIEALVVLQDPGALGNCSTVVFFRRVGAFGFGDPVFVAMGKHKIVCNWRVDNTIAIAHNVGVEDIINKIVEFKGVAIHYESLSEIDSIFNDHHAFEKGSIRNFR